VSRRAFIAAMSAVGAGAVAACSKATRRAGPTGPQPSSTLTNPAPPPTTAASGRVAAGSPGVTVHHGPASYVASGPAASRGVALTFHTAGDPAIVGDLLDQAGRLGAKATFFVVGAWAAANPAMVERILAGGHELGNHTWSHIDLAALPPARMLEEIQRCADVLERQTGSIGRWFRPSQIDVPTAAILDQAGSVGYATSLGYDIDPLDYTDPGASLIESRVRAHLHGGAIVSLHTLYVGTSTAFTPIVATTRAVGLRPVTVSEVLAGNLRGT
jgi:peptidoglycan/xylan/chitin deacetylase (PgdA/CDA1 family)